MTKPPNKVTEMQSRISAYSECREPGTAWLPSYPSHWGKKRLKFVAPLATLKASPKEAELIYVGLENIQSWTGKQVLGQEEGESEGQSNLFQPGDVLFGKLRPYLAKVLRVRHKGRCTGELLVLRPRELTQDYLYYWCLSPAFINTVDASTYGTKMPRASWGFIGNTEALIPPLPEQRGIVTFLDRETVRTDEMIAKKERLIGLLEEKRTALVSALVTGKLSIIEDPATGRPCAVDDAELVRRIQQAPDLKVLLDTTHRKPSGIPWLGDIPKHWEVKPLGRIGSVVGGATPFKGNLGYWDGDIPWASPKDMKVFMLGDAEDHVSQAALLESALTLIDPPAVLFVVRGMILAHSFPVALSTVPLTINQDMKALLPDPQYDPKYVAYLLRGIEPNVVAATEESGHGTKCLRTEVWSAMKVGIPPKHEQEVITAFIDQFTGDTNRLLSKNHEVIAKLKEYRAALITAAVTGHIEVTEPSS